MRLKEMNIYSVLRHKTRGEKWRKGDEMDKVGGRKCFLGGSVKECRGSQFVL